jgi:aminopeptidase YwaD
VNHRLAFSVVLLAAATAVAGARERQVPFWPDAVPAAIRAQVDGVAALETVRELGRFHRVHGSPGFFAAAELVKKKLLAAGLADASIERLPADGRTRYAHFPSYYGWDAASASLEEISPRAAVIETFPGSPVALADYSQDADVTAELVDAGAGADAAAYAGKDVKGKIVLADGPLPEVHRAACEERGAAGFLSDFPNQTTAWSGDDKDLVRWGHLSPYELRNRFAFMISKRQAETLRARLAAGERIVLRARVAAKMVPASFDVVTATIPGSDPAGREVILTAHLCHESAGANDNASGSAAIFEVARALEAAIAAGTLPKPRLTIRFAWFPEIAGSQAWLVRHPEVVKRLVAGIHMDMVGGVLATTHGTFHLSRTAETLPSAAHAIASAWFDHVVAASSRYAEKGGDAYAGLVWAPGARESFLGDVRQIEMGSDHEVFEEASFGVPMVYFHDWPDVTVHTNKDQPENLDATKLGRVAYLGAGIAWTLAALPDAEAPKLLVAVGVEAGERVLRARESAADAAVAQAAQVDAGLRAIRSVTALWKVPPADVRKEEDRLRRLATPDETAESARAPRDSRVPVRNPEIRGPLDVYYFSFLTASGIDRSKASVLEESEGGDVLAYEAFNLVDGRRSVSDIRDSLTGLYFPVSLAGVAGYLDILAKAGAIHFGR